MVIQINLRKAKGIAHDIRRAERAKEFAPLDEQIMKQIPGVDTAEVEAQRQAIRDKYAAVQDRIDSALDAGTLKQIVGFMK